ncbi:MAG: hypothetical protein ACI8UO_003398 [Verrucomicrobiales bacterium]|jgi:hypothetical protein
MQCCLTASGKVLSKTGGAGIDLEKTLEEWRALPKAERAPGAVKIADRGAADPQYVELSPPQGGLIIKVYTRALMSDGEGKHRYVTGKDLWLDEDGKETLEADYQDGRTAAHQAQPHHMWLSEPEWKSLMPANPMEGDEAPLPSAIADRIFRWHLNPLRFYGRYGPDALDSKDVQAGQMTLTTESVSPDVVRLRLEGAARLGQIPPADVVEGKTASLDRWGYEPRVLGFLEYNPRTRVITRFDIVALGEHFGRLGLGRRAPSRIGLQPLGIAFQLINGDQPADRVPPGRPSNSRSYFDLSK